MSFTTARPLRYPKRGVQHAAAARDAGDAVPYSSKSELCTLVGGGVVSAAVGGSAALRMRHTPCGCDAPLLASSFFCTSPHCMRRGRCPHRPVQARSILCPEFAARCGHRALRKVLNWAQRRSLLRRAGCPQPAAGTSVLLLATSKHAWRGRLGQERLGAGAEEEQSGQQDTGDLQLHR